MAVNKVEINGETKLDLTGDTVTPETLLSGATAHNAAGEQIDGAVAVAPASNTTPKAPGTASAGSESAYARGDHVHPSDDTKLSLSGGTMTGTINLGGKSLHLKQDTRILYMIPETVSVNHVSTDAVAFRRTGSDQDGKYDCVPVQVGATLQQASSPIFSDYYRWGPAVSVADLPTILGRKYPVNKADTNYTTLMARGESLNAAEVTPAVNGAIAWVYG